MKAKNKLKKIIMINDSISSFNYAFLGWSIMLFLNSNSFVKALAYIGFIQSISSFISTKLKDKINKMKFEKTIKIALICEFICTALWLITVGSINFFPDRFPLFYLVYCVLSTFLLSATRVKSEKLLFKLADNEKDKVDFSNKRDRVYYIFNILGSALNLLLITFPLILNMDLKQVSGLIISIHTCIFGVDFIISFSEYFYTKKWIKSDNVNFDDLEKVRA